MTHYSFFEGKIITFIFIKMMSRDLLVQMAYSKNYCHFTGHKTWQGQLYCYQAVHFSILVLKTNMKANYISVLFLSDIAILLEPFYRYFSGRLKIKAEYLWKEVFK